MAARSSQSASERKPLLLLIDGHAMVYRAFFAIREPLSVRRTGEEVRGVFGFLNTFLRTLADWKPTHCAVAFDLSKPTFRHQMYDEYKAQRPPAPSDLKAQFPHVRRFMDIFGVPMFEREGFEADDVLGTLSRQAEEQDVETLILTGDTDELQLVSPRVKVLLAFSIQRKSVYDVEMVQSRYGGLGPESIPDIKALVGDPSDNIPGVSAVGDKTAIKLLSDFGTVEGIYEHLEEVGPPRIQARLRESEDQARQGKFLTTIVRDVPIELDLEQTRFWRYDRGKVVEALRELEFFSMVSRIPDPIEDTTAAQGQLPLETTKRDTRYRVVDTPAALESLGAELDSTAGFAFRVEATGQTAMTADLVGLSFSKTADEGWYVPVGHAEGEQLPLDVVLEALRPVLESAAVPKTAHNANFDVTALRKHGVHLSNLAFDTILAAHVAGRRATDIEALALELLNIELTPSSQLLGTGRKRITMAEAPIDSACQYSVAHADAAGQLRDLLDAELAERGGKQVFDSVEMPLVPVLVRMQADGVAVDSGHLQKMSAELELEVERTQAEMYAVVGHEFNIGSSQQLGDVLFTELRLPHTKRTQKGYSTDASSLEGIKQMIGQGKADDVDPKALEVLDHVLEYRQVTKIKSTYVDALPSLVNPETGRIHTSFNQTGSATGRVSSNDPNVQNIPIRTELGRRVRSAFIAQNTPAWTLLAADYSQIELRILAHLSEDPGLLEAIHSGQDIHAATASSVYGVPVNEIDREMRRIAKVMNFGVVYGLSPFGISQQTGLSADEGRAFIESYFGSYPGINRYIEETKDHVRKTGYVQTLMGRRRYIPEVAARNFHVRGAGERMAVNMPIQGTAADILKTAMVRIQQRLDESTMQSMMIVQVHDELIFETPRAELDDLRALVLEIMPASMELAVPLDVELKTGDTWGDME